MAGATNTKNEEQLFSDVYFFITTACSEKVKQLLKQGGAKREFYISDLVTHVITESAEFPQQEEAKEYRLPIVLENWVTMSVKSNMLLPTKPFSPDADKLFSKVVICPSQIPCDDLNMLWAMVTYHGGTCQLNLNHSCTHLVIPKPAGEKYSAVKRQDCNTKIVTPSWVVDSIKNSKLQPEDDYMPFVDEQPSKTGSFLTPEDDDDKQLPPATVGEATSGSTVDEATPVTPKSASATPNEPSSAFMSPISPVVKTAVSNGNATECTTEAQATTGNIRETPVKTEAQASDGQGLAMLTTITTTTECALASASEKPTFDKSSLLEGCVFVVSDYQDAMEHTILDTWIEVIEQHGGKVDPFYSKRCTHLLCLNQHGKIFKQALEDGKAIVTAYWLNDVLTRQKLFPPSNPLHLPVPFVHNLPECKTMTISATGYVGKERQLVRHMAFIIGAKYTGFMMRTNTHLICKSSEGMKYQKAREWGIPCVNAKWLGDIVSGGRVTPCALTRYSSFGDPDELSTPLEMVSHLMGPWKDFKVREAGKGIKRKEEELSDNPDAKRRRLSGSAVVEMNSNTPRVLFTGLPMGQVTRLKQVVLKLGGQLADSHRTCTHLVTTKIVRTVKFLSAISVAQHIVSPSWLEKSYESSKFLDPTLFLLQDVTSEKTYGMNLQESSTRARARRCLQGIQVYVSPNVEPSPGSMKEIIECAGGQMVTAVPPRDKLASLKTLRTNDGWPAFIVVTCPADISICMEFYRCGFDLYSVEVILSGVLQQQVSFDQFKFTLE